MAVHTLPHFNFAVCSPYIWAHLQARLNEHSTALFGVQQILPVNPINPSMSTHPFTDCNGACVNCDARVGKENGRCWGAATSIEEAARRLLESMEG